MSVKEGVYSFDWDGIKVEPFEKWDRALLLNEIQNYCLDRPISEFISAAEGQVSRAYNG